MTLFEDVKRIRDDTFHYASDRPSVERLRATVNDVANMEGVFRFDGDELRAD